MMRKENHQDREDNKQDSRAEKELKQNCQDREERGQERQSEADSECRKTECLQNKRSRVVFELNGLAHAIKHYFVNISERASGGNVMWEGLTPAHFGVVAYLWENREKEIYQKNLEERMKVQRSTVSKTLQLLEKKGIVHRQSVEHDARLKKITLTKSVLDGISGWMSDADKIEQRATKGFSEEELDEFIRLIEKMKQNFA